MLTKEKRNKIIAGALVLSMLASVAGCGNNETEEQEENGQSNSTMVYPWWMFWHWPMFGGTTTNVRQTPAPNTAGTADTQSKVSSADAKTAAPASKVQSPATGKTGISSGAARSSAVS